MKKTLAGIGILVAGVLGIGATHHFGGTTQLDCVAAGTRDVYDTPSGNVDPGYYDPTRGIGSPTDATSGKSSIVANVTGTEAFEICTDASKNQYKYPITQAQLDSFKASTQPLPSKSI